MQPSSSSPSKPEGPSCAAAASHPVASRRELATAHGIFFKCRNRETDRRFYPVANDVLVAVYQIPGEDFHFRLSVEDRNRIEIASQDVEPEMGLEFYPDLHSIVWIDLEDAQLPQLSVVFRCEAEVETRFTQTLHRCHVETSTRFSFDRIATEDKDYYLGISRSAEAANPEEIQCDPEVDFLAFGDLSLEDLPAVYPDPVPEASASSSGYSLLVDSARVGRSFAVREACVDVYRRGSGEQCEKVATLGALKTPSGAELLPNKVMLHEGDRTLVTVDPKHPGSVYPVDLERGTVVEEWKSHKDATYRLVGLNPAAKYADPAQATFAVVGPNVVFGMDPRLSGPVKAVDDPSKYAYSKNPNFSCCATTTSGELVVGSETGEIRLYSGIPGLQGHNPSGAARTNPKAAKTSLPGFGFGIRGLDVTADGQWVLATCPKFLLLINTKMPKGQDTGFSKRMGADKPRPVKLELRPEDAMRVGGPRRVDFTRATFNTGRGEEVWLVTSTGEYLVAWNFRRVKAGVLDDYVMKRTPTYVVSGQFLSVGPDQEGQDAPVVLAHADSVRLEKRQRLERSPFKLRSASRYVTADDD